MSGDSGDAGDVAARRSERYRNQIQAAGTVIKAARLRAGWSQQALADKAGLNKSDVSRLETGKHLEISAGRFFDLCEALSLDPVYVWTGETRAQRKSQQSTPPPPSVEVESGRRVSSRPKP